MALTISNAGNGTSTASSATQATGATVTANVGDWLLAFIGCDNNGASGAASLTNVQDSAGNTWVERAKINWSPGGVAGDGITLGIYSCQVINALVSGTVTANFSPNTAAKVIDVFRIQPGAGEAVSFIACDATGIGSSTNAPSITTSVNASDTIFGAVAMEDRAGPPTYDTDTVNGSWSAGAGRFADSGSVATSANVTVQYKTVSATGNQTYNVGVGSARDSAISYIILKAVAAAQERSSGMIIG
jgi:hypothetical protein